MKVASVVTRLASCPAASNLASLFCSLAVLISSVSCFIPYQPTRYTVVPTYMSDALNAGLCYACTSLCSQNFHCSATADKHGVHVHTSDDEAKGPLGIRHVHVDV